MTPDSSLAAGILIDTVLCTVLPLLLSALLNSAHAACVYLEDAALRQMESNGDRKAGKILALFDHSRRVGLSVDLFTYLCLALSTFRLQHGLVFGLARAPWSADATTAALTLACLVWIVLFAALGVSGPRRLAGYFTQDTAFSLFGVLSAVCLLLFPAVRLIELLSALLIRLAGKNPAEQPHHVTEEEIRMLVDEGEERGTIEVMEKEMINNIFEFDDRDVTEVMTHRTEVAAVGIDATVDEVVAVALETGYSRIPVYGEDIDNIRGIVYAKDLLKYLQNPEGFSLASELRTPLYVVESASCSDVFALFQREKTQIAVVVDEYGGTYGIVTMEDLLESIVGNIQDEYDNEQSLATQVEEGVYILDGSMGIGEFERLLGLRVPDDSNADTLGGFVTELL
ncbi:MAG: hemolysin family protein, partial [Oscillospiraceae bacterium]